jgi:tetratricopeptide (TPR) repeat protein
MDEYSEEIRMLKRQKAASDRLAHIRSYLEKKSKPELVTLLLDLVQGMDEPTRQRFWEHLAPPGMATADLRYPSAEDFLVELEAFTEEVSEGEYSDEETATYYGEDNYNDYDDYDPDDHAGVKALRAFFYEADSYFDAGQFAVAAGAYDRLLDLVYGETYETLGVPDPLEFLPQDQRQVVSRYFTAMQASRTQNEFFDQVLRFLALHEHPADLECFLELVGNERRPALQAHLETWADSRVQSAGSMTFYGLPFHLRLLLRFYEQAGRVDDMRSLWVRFCKLYPACYTPLLADREAAGDWKAVLNYAQEALEIAHPPHPAYFICELWDSPDTLSLRGYLARAYSAIGDTAKAFDLYRPAFDDVPSFDTFSQARRLANAVSAEKGCAFTKEAIDHLCQQGERQRYLLCQVYLSEGRFDEAYSLVSRLTGYQGMEESKLVAKAHLVAALGSSPDERMGSNLRDLYAKIEQGEKESLRFLRDALPQAPAAPHTIALERAEAIYRRLMQTHIDNGRKTYATGAYYCALLGEIAFHESRLVAFKQWHEGYMEAYKRFRALRSEMDLKVGPVLRSQPPAGR